MAQDVTELQILAEAMPEIVWLSRPDGTVTFLNQKWMQYTGLAIEESLGWGWIRAIHPDDAPAASKQWRYGLRSNEPFEIEFRMRDSMGIYRWFRAKGVPQHSRSGAIIQWVGNTFDIDPHRRSLDALRLLADTRSALTTSLDLQSMLDMLLPVLVPRVCDWAVVSLHSLNALRVEAILHRDRAKDKIAQRLVSKAHPAVPDHAVSPTYAALETGEPQVWNELGSQPLERFMRPEALATLQQLGQRSALVVPLRDGPSVIGTLGAVRTENDEPFTERDIPLLQEIGDRAAMAIARAQIFERERLIADTLQLASLPTALPSFEGFTFDAHYAPARNESKIGGDWYDVFSAGDTRLAITVGDVSGSGLNAAVAMGKIRNTIRALTLTETDPAELLRATDAMIHRENPDLLVTAVVAFLDAKHNSLILSSAGHPPPLLRTPHGDVIELPADGLPLGLLSHEHPPVSASVQIPQGSLLCLYSDGLIEETRDIVEGERLLREALADEAVLLSRTPAKYLYEQLLPDGSHDDVAILTLKVESNAPGVRLHSPLWEARWRFEVLEFGAPANAREAFLRFLRTRGSPDADYASAELIFGELIGNVVRHAAPPLFIELNWGGEYPVLHVQDRGPGFEWNGERMPGLYAEGGRGLSICSKLAREFEVTRIPQFGTHIRATIDIPRASPTA